jgi:hypothetical protein
MKAPGANVGIHVDGTPSPFEKDVIHMSSGVEAIHVLLEATGRRPCAILLS